MDAHASRTDEWTSATWLRHLFLSCLAFELFLVAMHLAANLSGSINLNRYFNLNNELTLASWFSAAQLLTTGLLMIIVAAFSDRHGWPSPRFCWVVGLGFIFLSLDETASIHESITELTRLYLSTWAQSLFNGQHGAWIFVYGALGLILGATMLRDLAIMWRHHRSYAVAIAVGFAILVAGGVIVEIGGYYRVLGRPMFQIALEEFLEMVGGTIILMGAIAFFNRSVRLRATV